MTMLFPAVCRILKGTLEETLRLVTIALGIASIATAGTSSAPQQVTFNRDVLPVLQKNCQTCHRPGEAAPMSFLSYADARPWAKAMKFAVLTKKMPPWFADPHYGAFANDRSLSQGEIDTIVSWANSGASEGDPKDAPKPLTWVDGWAIGQPDEVISMPAAFSIPASGTIDYQYIVIPTGFKEDRWVRIAEARPGDRARVHHIIAFIREPGNPWLKDAKPGVPFVPPPPPDEKPQSEADQPQVAAFDGDVLGWYAPGLPPTRFAPGQARLVKAGSDIVLQMHYTANGTPGSDVSKVGLVFANEPPAERVVTLFAADFGFTIPPQARNFPVSAKTTLYQDASLISLLPHMHFRGKDFTYRLMYPDGRSEEILSVPKYNFNWQLQYILAQPKTLPKGTVIECSAHFDNSPNNPFNPDPAKEVHYGEQTWEEMMIGFFDAAIPRDQDPAAVYTAPKR